MKPIHYVKKYKLKLGTNFNHKEFINDLTLDFITLLEIGKGREEISAFEQAINDIRAKFDGISNKTAGVLPEKLWNFFFASVIAKMREGLFPEEMARRTKDKEERKRKREERKQERRYENEFWENMFRQSFLASLFVQQPSPVAELKLLGLNESSSEEDIKASYRTLSKKHHPDKGGSKVKFVEITDAKNKCLAWLSKK